MPPISRKFSRVSSAIDKASVSATPSCVYRKTLAASAVPQPLIVIGTLMIKAMVGATTSTLAGSISTPNARSAR